MKCLLLLLCHFSLMCHTLIFNVQTSVPPAVREAGLTTCTEGPVPPQIKHSPLPSQKIKYSLNTVQGLISFCSKATSGWNGYGIPLGRFFLSTFFLLSWKELNIMTSFWHITILGLCISSAHLPHSVTSGVTTHRDLLETLQIYKYH